MQFHLNGYKAGDPSVAAAARESAMARETAEGTPDRVDVLIVGCGPAGLTLAAQLAAFPDIKTMIVDQKTGRLVLGQADGIACRTMEMFEAFGFAGRVLKEAYWVNETVFWKPGESSEIVRSGRIQDTEDGLSEFPHVILNQARVHDFYLDLMRHSPTRLEPRYGRQFLDLDIATDPILPSHPVTVRLACGEGAQTGAIETVRARYVVGCDGARSRVRGALGLELRGDSARQAWGVMDVLAVTNFPDVRLKVVLHSAGEGSGLIIPREGGYLIRLYIELDKLGENERVADRGITLEQLIAAAQGVLHPYTLDVKEVAWWSVYEIGQRLCERFDDVPLEATEERTPHVFIAGDACHTHSPKAGQGMNVSMQDSFNLGWKLAAVLRGHAEPHLLRSYSAERHAIAKELIDFDRELATMISAASKRPEDGGGVDPAEFQRYFLKQARFTAGTATRYAPALLTAEANHQQLAEGFVVGMRFHSAGVIRLADAKPMQLGHTVEADGRWRLFVFAGRQPPRGERSGIQALCDFLLKDSRSPLRRFTPAHGDVDSVIDVRAIYQEPHREMSVASLPAMLVPRKGRYGLIDYEKAFCPDFKAGDIFDLRGINRAAGCIVVVRPDQYVATVVSLDDYGALTDYFDRFMMPA